MRILSPSHVVMLLKVVASEWDVSQEGSGQLIFSVHVGNNWFDSKSRVWELCPEEAYLGFWYHLWGRQIFCKL